MPMSYQVDTAFQNPYENRQRNPTKTYSERVNSSSNRRHPPYQNYDPQVALAPSGY